MIPFELFGQAWVLFRGADGRPGCILDECAHRACPLSIGKVVDGTAVCPYHGEARGAGRWGSGAQARVVGRHAGAPGSNGRFQRLLLAACGFLLHPPPVAPARLTFARSPPARVISVAGWRFDTKGECVKMPSTVLCRGVAGASCVAGLRSRRSPRAPGTSACTATAPVLAAWLPRRLCFVLVTQLAVPARFPAATPAHRAPAPAPPPQ